MIKVYRYKAHAVVHCAAPSEAVARSFGGLSEFETYFGGGITYGLPSNPNYVGVWGSRNASCFRRLLREALGKIEIVDRPPPARMTTAHTTGHRLSVKQRAVLEAQMRAAREGNPT